MRIAMMMRAMEQDSGFHAIVQGLVEAMLQEGDHDYLLYWRSDKYLGHFSRYHNATERVLSAPHKLLWDQVAVPYHAWRDRADIIYNPKFSVPFVTSCPTVMGLQEPAWWAWPEHYEWFDRHYMRTMLPFYIRKARHLFPISQFVVDENRKFLKLPMKKVTIAYPAPKPIFRPIRNADELEAFRREHRLPERFIFTVTRVDHPGLDNSNSFFPGKNMETAVRAFIGCRHAIPHHLVIAGRRVREYLQHLEFSDSDLERIEFLDFVPNEQLPMFLNLADLFVIPSFYESYAMSLVEALSCGCPVVASNTGACPEITAGAALLADPDQPEEFARMIIKALSDPAEHASLAAEALQRAAFFSWPRTARLTIDRMMDIVDPAVTARQVP